MDLHKYKRLITDLFLHFAVSIILGVFLYYFTNNLSLFFLCLASGIFIDLDHLVDYFTYYGLNFNLLKFFKIDFLKSGKVYVFLHSWELLIILFILGFYFNHQLEALALGLGLTGHLMVDSLFQKAILPYFLTYRIYHKFDANRILPHCEGNNFTPLERRLPSKGGAENK